MCQWLESKCGSAFLLNDEGTTVISELLHAKLVFWLRDEQADAVLEVYAATDSNGLLRELDIFTMMDHDGGEGQRADVQQMIQTTLTYTAPTLTPGENDASMAD